jgi:hypothetical protein
MVDNTTFFEAYNCDSAAPPKPSWADRARKQIYRADYVPYHFVHYSTVTQPMLTTYKDNPKAWSHHYHGERAPSERNTDDENEATMLHTKTTTDGQSSNWKNRCHYQFEKKWRGCYIGFPFPSNVTPKDGETPHREDGMEYNCYENDRITTYWAPKLRDALEKRRQRSTA